MQIKSLALMFVAVTFGFAAAFPVSQGQEYGLVERDLEFSEEDIALLRRFLEEYDLETRGIFSSKIASPGVAITCTNCGANTAAATKIVQKAWKRDKNLQKFAQAQVTIVGKAVQVRYHNGNLFQSAGVAYLLRG